MSSVLAQPWPTRASLVPMSLADALCVCHDIAEAERRQLEALSGEPYDADAEAMYCTRRDTRYALKTPDGTRVMVGGFDLVHPRLARCWSLSTARWGEFARDITRATRHLIDGVLEGTEVHRMEIVSHGARADAHRWYTRSLGFTEEAVLRCYGHAGEDFVLFARTTDGGLG